MVGKLASNGGFNQGVTE